jgi:steroid delta-isomerase-like uncharacterized protein
MSPNVLVTRGFIQQVINEGRLELAGQFLTSDSIHHELEFSAPDFLCGPEAVAEVLGLYRLAFPDLRLRIEDEVAAGDRVVTRFRMEGTHRGSLMGIAASGRRVVAEGIRIDRIERGKIAETWITWDTLGLLRQIGALPEMRRSFERSLPRTPVAPIRRAAAGDGSAHRLRHRAQVLRFPRR